MKKAIIYLLTLCIISTNYAQFIATTQPERQLPTYSLYSHIYNLQNDSKSERLIGTQLSDLYVAVWDAAGSSFYYKQTLPNDPNTIINEGYFSIPDATMIRDIGIINTPIMGLISSKTSVVVIYQSNIGGFPIAKIAFYEWTPTGFLLNNDYVFENNYVYNMRLDVVDDNVYGVVYSHYDTVNSTYVLKAFGGYSGLNAFSYPLISFPKIIQSSRGNVNGNKPDIALTSIIGREGKWNQYICYFTYTDNTNNHAYVRKLDYYELLTFPSIYVSSTLEHIIQNYASVTVDGCTNLGIDRYGHPFGPQIDAPNLGKESWAVIVQQLESYLIPNCNNTLPFMAANRMIGAYKHNGSLVHEFILNDGSLSGTVDMASNPVTFNNYLSQPAVAFSKDFSLIQFGWGKTMEHTLLGDHDYLGIVYDINSNDILANGNGDTGYKIIDFDATNMPYIPLVAFSGNNINMTNMYVCFANSFDNTSPFPEYIYDKHPSFGYLISDGFSTKAPKINNLNTNDLIAYCYPNPFSSEIQLHIDNAGSNNYSIQVQNILGSVIFSKSATLDQLNVALQRWFQNNTHSGNMYIITVSDVANDKQKQLKIIKK